jgi:glutathione S-transferase
MTVVLYDNPASGNYYKVRLLFHLLGVGYERRELSVIDHSGRERVERHLDKREYLGGERFTIADIALYAYTHVAPEGGFDLKPYPSVRAWLKRVATQPGIVPITA